MVESNCPFCNVSQFGERLIAEVNGFYVLATLGQITDGGYVLLVPKEHVSCMGTLTEEQTQNMFMVAEKICLALIEEYGLSLSGQFLPLALFEHGIVGQTVKHAHLHFLPTILNLTPRVKNDFPNSVVQKFEYAGQLQDLYKENPRPYLYWVSGEMGDDVSGICWDPPAPPQYLRIIAAEALGRPERANWRTMDPELDKRLWSDTVRRLKPYF